jgi:ATP-dependent protease ClpP protease subunit
MKTIAINGIIGYDITDKDFAEKLNGSSTEKVRIIINSPGGLVSQGFEIFNMIQSYRGDVEVILGAEVSSIASYIAMSVPYEKRKAFRNSSMMWHESSGGLIMGRARDLRGYADRLEGINSIMADAYAIGTGITKDEARSLMMEDYFITGWEQLTDKNIISDLVEPGEVDYHKFVKDTITEQTIRMEEAKARMYATEERILKDTEKANADLEKAAAFLKKDSKPVAKPEENKNIEEEVIMNLQEFLKANPDAKAEYDSSLQSAEAKGKEIASSKEAPDLMAERKRIADIIALAGVEVTPVIAEAIDKGLDVKDYAVAALKAEQAKRVESNPSSNIFGALVAKQTPGEQDKETAETAQADEAKELAAYEAKLAEAREAKKNGRVM